MRKLLLSTILSWAVLLCVPSADAQTQVEVSFQTNPVQTQTGTDILFTVVTVPNIFSMTWSYQGGVSLGAWVNGAPSVNNPEQFRGRVTITATTLRIGSAQLRDAGQYTVLVVPAGSTGLRENSASVTLNVFDAVTGVNLFVPSVAIETRSIALNCTFQTGTGVTFLWTKGGTTLAASSRITITGGSLVINPGERADAGDYTCTVSNPVSARAATQTLTVFYGPDTPVLTKAVTKECVGEGDVWVGRTITLTCTSVSLPLAQFSWQFNGQAISAATTGSLSLQPTSTEQSGRYACTARNSVTALTSEQGTDLVVTDVCLDVGEVVGVVIGSFILLILLIILIILIARCILVRRRRREASAVQKNDANPQPIVRAQTFQNRRQQTQAALLHPGTQTQHRAPTPPPVIPLEQFQALPKERTRQRDPRPPVNMPVAQRPHHTHHRQQPHATIPTNHHHHPHHPHHHTGAHRQQPHAQTWQQQPQHRGRPR